MFSNYSLRELLRKAQSRTNDIEKEDNVPCVEPTLREELRKATAMHSRLNSGVTFENKEQANKFLGSRGIDLQKLTDKVESLDLRNSLHTIDPLEDNDVPGYLKQEREKTIVAIIEETNKNIFEAVDKRRLRSVHEEWGKFKRQLCDGLSEIDEGVTTEMAEKTARPGARLNAIELLYAGEIMKYTQSVNPAPNLIAKLTQLARDQLEDNIVHQMWCFLEYMVNATIRLINSGQIKSRQMTPQIVQQGRIYLEQCYKNHILSLIERSNLAAVPGGGIPNVYNKVNNFVHLNFRRRESLAGLLDVANGRPLWPLIYYCIRSGDFGAAVEYLKGWDVCSHLRNLLEHKHQLKQTSQKSKHELLESTLKLEYKCNVINCSDPYKKMVYTILLGCDPDYMHLDVIRTPDDFLWLQLTQNRSIDQLQMETLQSIVREYGQDRLHKWQMLQLNFKAFVLFGQFEAAIELLSRDDENWPHAVHMAIAINEISMLATPSDLEKPLLSIDPLNESSIYHLNLVRLVATYVKAFEKTDSKEAVHYYYLLRKFSDKDDCNLMISCLGDMLLENHNDAMMQLFFGKPNSIPSYLYFGGILEQLHCDKSTLAGRVGTKLAERTDYEPAIEMYLIGGQLDEALRLANSLLSQLVHLPSQKSSSRKMLYGITEHINLALTESYNYSDPKAMNTYHTFLKLLQFYDFYHDDKHCEASEILYASHLIPKTCMEVNDCLARLKAVGWEVLRVMSDVLLAAMDMIYKAYLKQKAETKNKICRELQLCALKERAKALINLTGTMELRMPADVNQKLIQMDIQMNL